ncbi:MAG: hypothetical protein IJZ42_02800 [Lachnospiraceae bacterium]|nr:hypothetical protein [Lachnospiraceae bacterium]
MGKKIDRLSDYGIVSKKSKTEETFLKIEKHFRSNDDLPSMYIKKLWESYEKNIPKNKKNNALNGYIFEAIVITALIKEDITPFYVQTNLEFVPNVNYDIILFPRNEKGKVDVSAPVVLSLKTSLRERYKQADLEGLALKDVYKRGLSYLITLDDESEITLANEKISKNDIRGLDGFLNATSEEFDNLVKHLKESTVSVPPPIQVIKDAKEIIVERENKDV